MDASEVKRIIKENYESLADEIGVGHWEITYDCNALESSEAGRTISGRCRIKPAYDQAAITLDPANLDDEADAIRVLRHELLHVALAPYKLFCEAVGEYVVGDERAVRAVDVLWEYAQEQAVINLERMYRRVKANAGRGPTPRPASGNPAVKAEAPKRARRKP